MPNINFRVLRKQGYYTGDKRPNNYSVDFKAPDEKKFFLMDLDKPKRRGFYTPNPEKFRLPNFELLKAQELERFGQKFRLSKESLNMPIEIEVRRNGVITKEIITIGECLLGVGTSLAGLRSMGPGNDAMATQVKVLFLSNLSRSIGAPGGSAIISLGGRTIEEFVDNIQISPIITEVVVTPEMRRLINPVNFSITLQQYRASDIDIEEGGLTIQEEEIRRNNMLKLFYYFYLKAGMTKDNFKAIMASIKGGSVYDLATGQFVNPGGAGIMGIAPVSSGTPFPSDFFQTAPSTLGSSFFEDMSLGATTESSSRRSVAASSSSSDSTAPAKDRSGLLPSGTGLGGITMEVAEEEEDADVTLDDSSLTSVFEGPETDGAEVSLFQRQIQEAFKDGTLPIGANILEIIYRILSPENVIDISLASRVLGIILNTLPGKDNVKLTIMTELSKKGFKIESEEVRGRISNFIINLTDETTQEEAMSAIRQAGPRALTPEDIEVGMDELFKKLIKKYTVNGTKEIILQYLETYPEIKEVIKEYGERKGGRVSGEVNKVLAGKKEFALGKTIKRLLSSRVDGVPSFSSFGAGLDFQ